MLALFCAAISGFTPVLGQTRDLGRAAAVHQSHDAPHSGESRHAGMTQCATRTECEHPAKLHPTLCAACYALFALQPPVGNPLPRHLAATPRPPLPLQATLPEPRLPPPRHVLS